jgi:hypothetical protein
LLPVALVIHERRHLALAIDADETLALAKHDAASFAAAIAAKADAARAAVQQDRQQLRLRLASLLCNCMKALAGEWRSMSWRSVLESCHLAAKLSCGIAALEETVQKAWVVDRDKYMLLDKGVVPVPTHVPSLKAFEQALVHPFGYSLIMRLTGKELLAAMQLSKQFICQPWAQAMQKLEPETDKGIAMVAGVLACMHDNNAAPGLKSSSNSSSSSSSSSEGDATGQGLSSSQDNAEVEVQLACIAVTVRALRLYGIVLDAALKHPCVLKASSAEARAVGAEQLAQQMEVSKAAGTLAPLPRQVQQQLDKRHHKQYLGSVKGATAVIGALLGNVNEHLLEFMIYLDKALGRIKRMQPALKLPDQVLQQLRQQTWDVEEVLDAGCQLWVDLGDGATSSSDGENDSVPLARNNKKKKPDHAAVESAAIRRERWALNAEGNCATLGQLMQRWADAVAVQLPSRRCCSNPGCTVLREVSEASLVSGKACCCGRCSAVDRVVHYCGPGCQRAHWPMHRPVCIKRRQQGEVQLQQCF